MLSDGTRVNDIPGMRKILHNGTLVFLPAVYLCVASNSVGMIVSRKVHVRAGECISHVYIFIALFYLVCYEARDIYYLKI
ncbi:hypothetical protein L9F63_023319 [Diploptera punctata]|uniref:Uncharacterized protein n=1 Tax=Diploptera punctata TaxID=6984 RepID=A0AAD7ZJJ0_DIPPU|nr:hypothetical protein L9F63_023319 [Diploptera punctata]